MSINIRTILSSPYTRASCLAISCVPSGLASSTTIASQSKSLSRNVPEIPLREEPDAPFSEGFCQEPDDDWKVLAFVIGRKYNRVFMSIHGWVTALHV